LGLVEIVVDAVKDQVEVEPGDIIVLLASPELWPGCEVVFHLVALIAIPYSCITHSQYVAVNCSGTLSLLEVARQQGVEGSTG
jgi:nucleoside-diphosphate-sugar epimerase